MFESLKGKILLKQSRSLAQQCINVVGKGETFDDTDDMIVTFVMGGYYFAIVYRHLQKREKDTEKLNWILGNAIIKFSSALSDDQRLQNRLVNVYTNARDNLCLDNDNENGIDMYEELITSYLHELYGKYITDDLMKRSISLKMLVPVYNDAVKTAKSIKL